MTHTTTTHPLRAITVRGPRAVLVATVGLTTLLLAGPAAAGCGPLDDAPTVGVPAAPSAATHAVLR